MLTSHHFLLPLFSITASAANLYASHYSGTINYLTLSKSGDAYSLAQTSSIKGCGNLPSWLTIDFAGKALYCTDEQMSGSASLSSFSKADDGKLTQLQKVTTPYGGVHNSLYGGEDGKGYIATAHYQSSGLSTFKLPLSAGQKPLQTFTYKLSGPGAVPSRQEASHPHSVFPDPTGGYLLIPDLGADLIRIYSIDKSSGNLKECPSAQAPAGTGPRHGAFWTAGGAHSRIRRGAAADTTVLFTANELANSIAGWDVTYPSGGCLTLKLRQSLNPYANNKAAVKGTKVGEVRVKDNFVYITNRNDKSYSGNDSLTQYSISAGTLAYVDNTSSYGTYPRTFQINKAGDLVAIGDQTTANVAIVSRDPTTGKLGKQVANLRIGSAGAPENEDGLSSVVWDE